MNHSPFAVIARASRPSLDAERRYVTMEVEQAKARSRQAAKWLPFSYPAIGLLRRQDWQRYIRQVAAYGDAVERYEAELRGGRTLMSFEVFNTSPETDRQIQVHIYVEGGSVHANRKAPERPVRIDGAPNKSKKFVWPRFEGFARSHIHIGRRGLESVFSGLDSGDSALVVNHPVHIDIMPDTQLSYHIHSQNHPEGIHGAVLLN
jgi:hypothetical protein